MAKELGLFKKYGVDVDLIYITASSTAVQALVAGEVAFVLGGGAAAIAAALSGGDTVAIASHLNSVEFALVVRPEIRTPADLRGKRIGIGRFGGAPDFTLRIVLGKWGLKADKDVVIAQLGVGQPGRLVALQAGRIDGVVVNPPISLTAKKLGLRVLVDFGEVIPEYFATGFVTTRTFIRRNRSTVMNILSAFVESVYFMKRNREEAIAVLRKYTKQDDREVLDEAYDDVIVKRFSVSPYPTLKGITILLEQVLGPEKAKSIDPGLFVDTSLLDEIEKEDFVKKK